MAPDNPDGVYLKVLLHFNGMFVVNPHSYAGGNTFLFTDVDFAGMDFRECLIFLERFIGEPFEKIYYCLRTRPLSNGIRFIESDLDYAVFLDTAYEEAEVPISLYLDHGGDGLDEWFDSGSDEVGSVIQGEVKEPLETSTPVDQFGMEDEIVPDDLDLPPLNITVDDEFLSKLCPNMGNSGSKDEDLGIVQHSENGEDGNDVVTHSSFNPNIPWKQQKPILGMRFVSPKQLKSMLCNYAVANGYQLCFTKNDSKRLLVNCCKGACTFKLWASWMTEEHSFQIKSLREEHRCARNFNLGSIVNYKWIGGHYTKEILHRQKLTIRQLRLEVIKKFGIEVSLSQCRRAKKHALTLIEGTLEEHYAKLWSYGAEIKRSNPGSTVKMDVLCMPDGKNFFSKFYVCFEGVKKGWLEGCRRVIGIDGCFLKGFCSGELLCAMGRDANNQIYPIAWGVVCVENKENWKWFLDLLIDDLNLDKGQTITLMSDQHKGIMEAVKDLLPEAEHRQCARHIAANFKKRFAGADFEFLFWKACNSTTEQGFKEIMHDMELLSAEAHKYLMDKDPKTWSKAYFKTGRCCDSVENGTSESFNAVIVEARKKPIITLLEELRMYMMAKLFHSKNKAWSSDIAPAIRQKLNTLKLDQRFWHVLPSGQNQFETRSGNEAFHVDLEKRTCSCRLWQLNGYGCAHSVAAINFLNRDAEAYVDPMFTRQMYLKTYQYNIAPMNGSNMWPETTYTPPLPPKSRRMPGRPAIKRKRDSTEKKVSHRVSKAGKRVSCTICKEVGHNKKTCTQSERPKKLPVTRNQEAVDGGSQPSGSTMESRPVQKIPSQTSGSTRKRKSERILKTKLAKRVMGKDGSGNTVSKPVNLE